jgi:hypothetical protein
MNFTFVTLRLSAELRKKWQEDEIVVIHQNPSYPKQK